jgi:uncharacterized protein
MTPARCPHCGATFDAATTPAMPFCSLRCQQLDLYRWLKEDYRVPVPPKRPDEEPTEGE